MQPLEPKLQYLPRFICLYQIFLSIYLYKPTFPVYHYWQVRYFCGAQDRLLLILKNKDKLALYPVYIRKKMGLKDSDGVSCNTKIYTKNFCHSIYRIYPSRVLNME